MHRKQDKVQYKPNTMGGDITLVNQLTSLDRRKIYPMLIPNLALDTGSTTTQF